MQIAEESGKSETVGVRRLALAGSLADYLDRFLSSSQRRLRRTAKALAVLPAGRGLFTSEALLSA